MALTLDEAPADVPGNAAGPGLRVTLGIPGVAV
jgi:hypothetical protein